MRSLKLEPLSAETFATYGVVIDSEAPCERYPINEGLTERLHAIATVDCEAAGGAAAISIFRAQPVEAGFVLRNMERHPLGSQAFINCSGLSYAVVVAPPGPLREDAIRGFLATAQQSVSYHRGTWHHFLLALGGPGDFVVVDRIGPGENCDELSLTRPLRLDLEP